MMCLQNGRASEGYHSVNRCTERAGRRGGKTESMCLHGSVGCESDVSWMLSNLERQKIVGQNTCRNK